MFKKIKDLFKFKKYSELIEIANSQGEKEFRKALWIEIAKGMFLGVAFVIIVFSILLFFFGEGADHPEYDPAKEFMREQQRENLQDD